jgi:PHD/YefM family antitoxin component YafN of YafNO toxin-antitoxin module
MSTSLIGTGRTVGRMRGVLARVALAASQIAAAYERYGPDQPWGIRRPHELEVQPAVLPRVGELPGRRRSRRRRKLPMKKYRKSYDVWYHYAVARDVLASAEARTKLAQLIEEIAAHPDITIEVGRQRRREVVLVSADRYDQMVERERLVEDLAWAAFAQERLEHPTSPPVSWDEAQRRRSRR